MAAANVQLESCVLTQYLLAERECETGLTVWVCAFVAFDACLFCVWRTWKGSSCGLSSLTFTFGVGDFMCQRLEMFDATKVLNVSFTI